MDYYYDTEFLEGTQKKRFLGIPYGNTPNTIDLISIGIVSEDGREYYAISKDFNLKEAWDRYELKINKQFPLGSEYWKKYWIRYNILYPIFQELIAKEFDAKNKQERILGYSNNFDKNFSYINLKRLVSKYGKANKHIAEEVKKFIYNPESVRPLGTQEQINLYTYYGAYDHVVFSWLFGRMIDLPKGFPMYSKDLKQTMDEKEETVKEIEQGVLEPNGGVRLEKVPLPIPLSSHPRYPKQNDEHNALSDARWNKELHKFVNKIQ